MIKLLSCLGIILVLPSCFVSLPTPASSITKIYQGNVVKASCDLYVFSWVDGYIATNDSSEAIARDTKQKIRATIPGGTELIAKRTVFRRLPAEVVTSLVCYSKDQNITFEISETEISECNLAVVNSKKRTSDGW